jgi:hypothetical protein
MSIEASEGLANVLGHPDLRRYLGSRFIVGVATQILTVAG